MQKYLEEKGEMCSSSLSLERIIYEPPYKEQFKYIDVKEAGENVVLNMFVEYMSHSQEAAEHNDDTFGMNNVASCWNSAIQLFTWIHCIRNEH